MAWTRTFVVPSDIRHLRGSPYSSCQLINMEDACMNACVTNCMGLNEDLAKLEDTLDSNRHRVKHESERRVRRLIRQRGSCTGCISSSALHQSSCYPVRVKSCGKYEQRLWCASVYAHASRLIRKCITLLQLSSTSVC